MKRKPAIFAFFVLYSSIIQADTHYVATNGLNQWPYTNWMSAATCIQDAVDASDNGDKVLVSNGVYETGGRVVLGTMTNRVAIDRAITLRSVNGPEATVIRGLGPLGEDAVRCAYVGAGSVLAGFTLTNGATRNSGPYYSDRIGGGTRCEMNGIVSNCVFAANSAHVNGGGVYGGSLYNCSLSANTAVEDGGGAYESTLYDCTFTANLGMSGGAAYGCTLRNCTLTNNVATKGAGGGAFGGTLDNCTLTGNRAWWHGGGAAEATLTNCTLKANSAFRGGGASEARLVCCYVASNSASHGGGAFNSEAHNCILIANRGTSTGGAADGGTLSNCTVNLNTALYGAGTIRADLSNSLICDNRASVTGGGCWDGTLRSCTIVGNSARRTAGGTVECLLNNCIVYFNSAPDCPNYSDCTLLHCCTTPDPASPGCIDEDPELVSPGHISSQSPCVGAGSTNGASDVDIDGDTWASPPSIGCDEPGAATGSLIVDILVDHGHVVVGFETEVRGTVDGQVSHNTMSYGDGVVETNMLYASHAWTTDGVYDVVFTAYNNSFTNGVAATAAVHVAFASNCTKYVWERAPTPCPPYESWTSASRTIEDAVSAQLFAGGQVWVSNGTYVLSSAVVVSNAIAIKGVGELSDTLVDGGYPTRTNRCFHLKHPLAVLEGLTISNGRSSSGGGIYSEWGGTIRDCVIARNSATASGGGVYCGLGTAVMNCVIKQNYVKSLSGSNQTRGGGIFLGDQCTLVDSEVAANETYKGITSAYGGGICMENATIERCKVRGNLCGGHGGGIACYTAGGRMVNSLICDNEARTLGGGLFLENALALEHCTIVANKAKRGGGVRVNGPVLLLGCVIYGNSGDNWENWESEMTYSHCCTTPDPGGVGNITNAPQLTRAFRLKTTSPCIDAGTVSNTPVTDIDGEVRWDHPWYSNGLWIVDIGADEFVDHDFDGLADWWETDSFGSITNQDGSGDGDNDDLANLVEYENGTSPTSSDSDGDDMPDGWEMDGLLDPLTDDADDDPDGDRMSNIGEYVADTDPQNGGSVLTVTRISREVGGTRIDWKGGRHARQYLERRAGLASTAEQWTAIFAVPSPTPVSNAVIDLGATQQPVFYRIRVER